MSPRPLPESLKRFHVEDPELPNAGWLECPNCNLTVPAVPELEQSFTAHATECMSLGDRRAAPFAPEVITGPKHVPLQHWCPVCRRNVSRLHLEQAHRDGAR